MGFRDLQAAAQSAQANCADCDQQVLATHRIRVADLGMVCQACAYRHFGRLTAVEVAELNRLGQRIAAEKEHAKGLWP